MKAEQIEKLKAAAEKAIPKEKAEGWNGYFFASTKHSEKWFELHSDFSELVSPSVVLTLLSEREELIQALEFYANDNSWSGYHRYVDTILYDLEKAKAEDGFEILLGGKLARSVLKRVRGEE